MYQLPTELIEIDRKHPRIADFNAVLSAIQEKLEPPYNVIETGTMRGRDFLSTLYWDGLINEAGGQLTTIDINPVTTLTAKKMCTDKVTAITGDSVSTIHGLELSEHQKINVAWLDSYDVTWLEPHSSALHHIMEFTALMPHLQSASIIAVDDNKKFQTLWSGKGIYIRKFMEAIGAEIIVENYIHAWSLKK